MGRDSPFSTDPTDPSRAPSTGLHPKLRRRPAEMTAITGEKTKKQSPSPGMEEGPVAFRSSWQAEEDRCRPEAEAGHRHQDHPDRREDHQDGRQGHRRVRPAGRDDL